MAYQVPESYVSVRFTILGIEDPTNLLSPSTVIVELCVQFSIYNLPFPPFPTFIFFTPSSPMSIHHLLDSTLGAAYVGNIFAAVYVRSSFCFACLTVPLSLYGMTNVQTFIFFK